MHAEEQYGYSELQDGEADDLPTHSTCSLLVVCLANSLNREMYLGAVHCKFYLFLKPAFSHDYIQKPDTKIYPAVTNVMSETSAKT
jgi:hypothetical protein